jgi:putative DNA primase/helicase
LPQFTDALKGREVHIIPDNDAPGRQRAKVIATALLGHAARLFIWILNDAKDISDWFDKGHSELELIEMIEKEAYA